jgi:hypothetical protein
VTCGNGKWYVICGIREVWGDWSWCNDRTGNRMEVVLGYCLDKFVEEIVEDTIGLWWVRWW